MRVAGTLLATLVAFIATDHLIFNSGYYAKILNPDSTAGALEIRLWSEHKRPVPDRNQVLAIGDSRMGFITRYSDQLKPEVGYTFGTIATPGSTTRDWYYMLRDADPTARRYAAILLPLYDYDDAETPEDHADRDIDLHYLAARLRWSDLVEFSGSYRSTSLKLRAALGILLRGTVYKADFQDLLMHRKFRLEYARKARREGDQWEYAYVGPTDDVAGLKIDWARQSFTAPSGMTPAAKEQFERVLFSPNWPASGHEEAYMKRWLGKIYDHYRGSGTRLIFFRLPRSPYPRPQPPPFNPHSAVRALARNPGVIVDKEHYFDFLERPELFKDPWHLNAAGSEEFSRALARHVRELLGPPHAL